MKLPSVCIKLVLSGKLSDANISTIGQLVGWALVLGLTIPSIIASIGTYILPFCFPG